MSKAITTVQLDYEVIEHLLKLHALTLKGESNLPDNVARTEISWKIKDATVIGVEVRWEDHFDDQLDDTQGHVDLVDGEDLMNMLPEEEDLLFLEGQGGGRHDTLDGLYGKVRESNLKD